MRAHLCPSGTLGKKCAASTWKTRKTFMARIVKALPLWRKLAVVPGPGSDPVAVAKRLFGGAPAAAQCASAKTAFLAASVEHPQITPEDQRTIFNQLHMQRLGCARDHASTGLHNGTVVKKLDFQVLAIAQRFIA